MKVISFNDTTMILNVEIEPSVIKTHEIVISGGTYSTQHENAVKIETINAEAIASAGTTNLSEAISRIPGADIISKGAGIGKPVIRGLSMNEVLVLNNGVRSENQQWSPDHPLSLNEFGIERIEIIKGPASLLYGSDAIGGVINLIKEKPELTGNISGDYNVSLHSNTMGISNDLGIKGASKQFFWGVRGGLKSHSDYLDGNGSYVPNSRFGEKAIKSDIGFRNSKGIFRLFYDYNKEYLGLTVPPAMNVQKGRTYEIWFQDLTNQLISSRNKLFSGRTKIEINAACQNNLRKLADKDIDMTLNTISYETKIHLPSNEKSEYIIGFQGLNQENTNSGETHVIPDATTSNYSFFGLVQYTFFRKLNAQTGIRYDYRKIDTYVEGIQGTLGYKPGIGKSFGSYSYSAGVTYNITKQLLFRANIASGYRSPNLAELTSNGQHGMRYETGNNNLECERNFETDISAHIHYKYFTVDAAVFNNRVNNYIYLSPTNDTVTGGSRIYRYMQSDARLYGGEAGVHFHPHPLDWLHVVATFSSVTGIQETGDYLPFIPANKFRTEIKAEKKKLLFFHNVFIKVATLTAMPQSTPSQFETPTDGYTLIGAGTGGEINALSKTIVAGINVNNILNTTYTDHLSTLKESNCYNIGRNINFYIKIPFSIK
ncbi:MAG: TonB-dependent receptor, partial [Bacteroidetes bacterium]|nr:TonB-dependent receptor [Bacteroidota bacterium]